MAKKVTEAVTEESENTDMEDFEGETYSVEADPNAVPDDECQQEMDIPDTGEDVEEEIVEEVTEEGAAKPKQTRKKNGDGVVTAGKREQRKLYNDGKVYDKNEGFVRINKNNSKRHEEFLELVASAKSANIKEGVISGVTISPNDERVMACISYGEHFNISIPVEMLCDISLQPPEVQKQILEGSKTAAYKKIATSMQGAKIGFRVLALNESDRTAIGDHIQVMSREGRHYYATPQKDGKPILVPGMKVNAQVMAVNRIGMWIEACGAEAFIKADEIDWLRRNDFAEQYAAGDTITVKILEIHSKQINYMNKLANIVTISASVKQCSPNPNETYYDMYNVGDTGSGVVTQITDKGIFIIFRERISVLVDFPEYGENPDIGDTINVRIRRKIDEGNLFYAQMNRILKRNT